MKLAGKTALVAGATRGAGRGIAIALGEQGATVYCTGRSSRETGGGAGARPETIEETAELVTARGGRGIAIRCDHANAEEVRALAERIEPLDILVNDIWGGDALMEFAPLWQSSLEKGFAMMRSGLETHIITNRFLIPKMLGRRGGLVVEVTDGDSMAYRGMFFYDLVKNSVIRMAFALAEELRRHGIDAIAVTPGFLRSEAMLDRFGVSEANWRDGAANDPHFIASETPLYVGRAIAALAADPDRAKKSGRVFSSADLAAEYGVTDADGSQPNFRRHLETHAPQFLTPRLDDAFWDYWKGSYDALVDEMEKLRD